MAESAAEYALRRITELGDGPKDLSMDKALRMRAAELGLSREQTAEITKAAAAQAKSARK